MKTQNSPGSLVNRLILFVLVLILGCLAYLVFQNKPMNWASADKVSGTQFNSPAATESSAAIEEQPPILDGLTNSPPRRIAQNRRVLPTVIGATEPLPSSNEKTNASSSKATSGTTSAAALPELTAEPRLGAVSGRVFFRGAPPPEKIILPVSSDPTCGPLHTEPLRTRFYVVASDGSLTDVFVYIKAGAPPASSPGEAVLLDQVGCEYQPYVFGLQTGQRLMIRNSDPLLHNVHITPKAAGNIESNSAQFAKGPDLLTFLASPELFLPIKCDVHPWMFAYACVVPHPFFAVTGKDGAFVIPNLPRGKYTLAAIHRKLGEQSREIAVSDSLPEPITFTFEIKDTGKELADSKAPPRNLF